MESTVETVTTPRAIAVAAVLAWGAFAFGAVYWWAYMPIGGAVLVAAVASLRSQHRVAWPPLTLAAAGLAIGALGVQLIPIGGATLARYSSAAPHILARVDVAYALGGGDHALTLNGRQTLFGTACFVMAVLWVIACVRLAKDSGTVREIVRSLLMVATVLAIIGFAQKATFNGKLLWFWTPLGHSWNSFGPFVNRNHFAGWMLLALALSVGYLFGMIGAVKLPKSSNWRDQVLWLGTADATPLLVAGAATLAMAGSLVWTMSRSGIAGAGVALAMMIVAAIRRSGATTRRTVFAGYLAFMMVGVVAWRGGDALVSWYGNTNTLEWRFALWKDTMPALKDFWLTGSGLNTYGTVMEVYPRTDTQSQPQEAHNDYLQLAVEGGALVCVPVFLLIASLARDIVRRLKQPQDEITWWIRMGAAAGICGIAVQELTDFSLQIPGVALLFATCVAIAIHEPTPAARGARRILRQASKLVTAI
jgi:hypothetical protein